MEDTDPSGPPDTDARPRFLTGLVVGLLVMGSGMTLALRSADSSRDALALLLPLGALLGFVLLFVRRYRRFGAGLLTASAVTLVAFVVLFFWVLSVMGYS